MSENKTKAPATRQKESGWGSDNEFESEMMATAMPPLFGLAASPAQPNPGDVKSFPDDEKADDRGIKVPGIPPSIVAKIIDEEDLKFESYEDNVGILTAGIGHKLVGDEKTKFPKGTKVSQAQIVKWAQKDMDGAWKATLSQCSKLGVSQFAFREALFSVNYQLGVNWHTIHVKTWGYMLKGEWEKAALEAADSTWNVQTPKRVTAFQAALRGLVGVPQKKASEESQENPKESMTEAFHRRVKEADEMRKNSANTPLDAASNANETSPKSNMPNGAAKAEPKGVARVKVVQTKLKELGLYTGSIDGIEFRRDKKESNTTKGIKAFQKSKGLPITGNADAATWGALNGKEAKSSGFAEPFRKKVAEAKEAAKAQESKGWGADRETDQKMNAMPRWWQEMLPAAQLEAGFQHESFAEVVPLLELGDHDNQKAGSTNCFAIAVKMVNTYLERNRSDLEASGIDVDQYKKVAAPCNGTKTNHEDYTGHLALVREDHAEREAMVKAAGPDNAKQVLGYEKGLLDKHEEFGGALTYIDNHLAMGIPVVVGLDHTYSRALTGDKKSSSKLSYAWYNEGTTDHYIVVVGSGFDNGRKFYSYFDPGRKKHVGSNDPEGQGANTETNRLVQSEVKGEEHIWRDGNGAMQGDYAYTLSIVCLFTADKKQKEDTILATCQNQLAELGYDAGKNGIWLDPKTKNEIIKFQKDENLPETAELDLRTRKQIGIKFNQIQNTNIAAK